ncbi:hypothetical protein [Bacillus sp. FJAT-29937]|uniref:hypothetical protein n=1 Tax=Bacillus sp. FJAT-29937 TaxID=1720553 RepID=UPI000830F416|nr:hypothetical protein [Bacillus sp. FJAT-29937]
MPFKKENNLTASFYFCRELFSQQHLNINYQPGFFDALKLIHLQKPNPYQKVPLRKNTILRFYYLENNTQQSIDYLFDFKKGSIEVRKPETISANYRHLSCFLIKEGNRVSYMAYRPNAPRKVAIKKQPPSLDGEQTIGG